MDLICGILFEPVALADVNHMVVKFKKKKKKKTREICHRTRISDEV